jgi:hypothetical protein
MSGKGHPLPGSDEARHAEIPEHLEREKGHGDDSGPAIQPPGDAVAPDGEPYRSGVAQESDMAGDRSAPPHEEVPQDRQRPGETNRWYTVAGGPHIPDRAALDAVGAEDDLAQDQAEHQDRGQSAADEEAGRD